MHRPSSHTLPPSSLPLLLLVMVVGLDCQTLPRCEIKWTAEKWGPSGVNLTALLNAAPNWTGVPSSKRGQQSGCSFTPTEAQCYNWPLRADNSCLIANESCLVVSQFVYSSQGKAPTIVYVVDGNQTLARGTEGAVGKVCIPLKSCRTEHHVTYQQDRVELYSRTAYGPSDHPKVCQPVTISKDVDGRLKTYQLFPVLLWSKAAVLSAAGLGSYRGVGALLAKKTLYLGTVAGDLDRETHHSWRDHPDIPDYRQMTAMRSLPIGPDWRLHRQQCYEKLDICAAAPALNVAVYNMKIGLASWGSRYKYSGEPSYESTLFNFIALLGRANIKKSTCLNTTDGINILCKRAARWTQHRRRVGGNFWCDPQGQKCFPDRPPVVRYYVTYSRNPLWEGTYPWFRDDISLPDGSCVLKDRDGVSTKIQRPYGECFKVTKYQPTVAVVGVPYSKGRDSSSNNKAYLKLISTSLNVTLLANVTDPAVKISSEQTLQKVLVYDGLTKAQEQAEKFLRKVGSWVTCNSPGASVSKSLRGPNGGSVPQAAGKGRGKVHGNR